MEREWKENIIEWKENGKRMEREWKENGKRERERVNTKVGLQAKHRRSV
jgi:hypothetical protein